METKYCNCEICGVEICGAGITNLEKNKLAHIENQHPSFEEDSGLLNILKETPEIIKFAEEIVEKVLKWSLVEILNMSKKQLLKNFSDDVINSKMSKKEILVEIQSRSE